jgi:predicted ATP-binding protein involved in virulence
LILASAKVGPFRSMNTEQTVGIAPTVTVFVGMNEAGKTVLLKALHKSADALGEDAFDPVEDYPRKDLSAYLKTHKESPAIATVMTFALSKEEVTRVNEKLGTALKAGETISISYKYDNSKLIGIGVDEAIAVKAIVKTFSTDAAVAVKDCKKLREIPARLDGASLTEGDQKALDAIKARIAASK